MMIFEIMFEPTLQGHLLLIIILLILGLWIYQGVMIYKDFLTPGRKVVRFSLNSLLALLLLFFLLQPVWQSVNKGETVLIYPAGTNREKIRDLKDSLNLKKSLTLSQYQGDAQLVYLYGQDYAGEDLGKLTGAEIRWISEKNPNQLTFVQWNDLLHLSESQVVNGRIAGEGPFIVQLKAQDELLVTDSLSEGMRNFQLSFRTRILGRNELTLIINDSQAGKVNFYVMPATPIQYSLLFGFPNPEGRFLSEYLVKRGDEAKVTSQISKGVSIGLGSGTGENEAKIQIIDPSQLDRQEMTQDDAAVLVINLSDPLKELPRINKQFGTNFNVHQVGTEPRNVGSGVTAAPFEFNPAGNQNVLLENTFAIQMTGNRQIGVSLLQATFPLVIAGDSVAYRHIWEVVLASFSPAEPQTYQLQQPVFQQIPSSIMVSGLETRPSFIRINHDSLFLQGSIVNSNTAYGDWIPQQSGWQTLNDSLEIYSYAPEEWADIHDLVWVSKILRNSRSKESDVQLPVKKTRISDWIWLILILSVFGLVWLEPRL